MKKNIVIVITILLAVTLAGCNRPGDVEGEVTETIAPATPRASGSDDLVMTQTTEIGEERSPNEGGDLTAGEAAETSSAADTGVVPSASTTPQEKPQ